MARQQADNQALATKLDVLTDEQVALQDVLAGVMHQLSQVHLRLCIAPLYVLVPKRSASMVDDSAVESVTVMTCLHGLMQPRESLTVKRYLVLMASSLCLTTVAQTQGRHRFREALVLSQRLQQQLEEESQQHLELTGQLQQRLAEETWQNQQLAGQLQEKQRLLDEACINSLEAHQVRMSCCNF